MGYIRVYSGDDLINQFELTGERTTIGRSAENDIVLSDSGVSRHHATIVRDGPNWYIEDNNSSNGVFLNKDKIEREKLSFWDEIQIYNFVLKFMAVPRQFVNTDPSFTGADTEVDRTVVVSIDADGELERLRSQKISTWLVHTNDKAGQTRHELEGVSFSVGRSKNCDIRAGGFFAPAVAARIDREGAQFVLVPGKRGKVLLNGERAEQELRLHDGDRISVQGVELQFFHRKTG